MEMWKEFDLSPNGYTLWKIACHIEFMEDGEPDEFE